MATSGLINGTLVKIYVDGVAVAYSTSASIDFSMSTREATTKDSAGWTGKKEGLREVSLSGDFLMAFDAAYGFTDLFTIYTARTRVRIRYSSEVAGDKVLSGYAYLTSLSEEAGIEETISGSFSLEGDGIWTEGSIT